MSSDVGKMPGGRGCNGWNGDLLKCSVLDLTTGTREGDRFGKRVFVVVITLRFLSTLQLGLSGWGLRPMASRDRRGENREKAV